MSVYVVMRSYWNGHSSFRSVEKIFTCKTKCENYINEETSSDGYSSYENSFEIEEHEIES